MSLRTTDCFSLLRSSNENCLSKGADEIVWGWARAYIIGAGRSRVAPESQILTVGVSSASLVTYESCASRRLFPDTCYTRARSRACVRDSSTYYGDLLWRRVQMKMVRGIFSTPPLMP